MAEILEKLCRLCATQCPQTNSIFRTIHDGKRSIDLLEYCLQHPIDTSACYPEIVCDECSKVLIQTYEFFVKYKKSEEYFLTLHQDINQIQVKIEVVQPDNVPENLDEIRNFIEIENAAIDAFLNEQNLKSKQDNSLATRQTYQCEICVLGFKIKSHLDRHMLSHTEKKPHHCAHCDESFATAEDLKMHMQVFGKCYVKKSKRSFDCFICDEKFRSPNALAKHRKIHQEYFECFVCKEIYKTNIELKQHLSDHPIFYSEIISDRPYQCELCFKCFKEKTHLKRHKFAHTADKPYKCKYCGRGFISNYDLNVHLRKFNAGENCVEKLKKQMDCPHCDIKLIGRKSLMQHMLKIHQIYFECFICEEKYKKAIELKQHMSHHPRTNAVFKCSMCGKACCNEKTLELHQKRKHSKRILNCEYCEKTFEQKLPLKCHVEESHGHELKKYQCNQCPEYFSLEFFLNSHLQMHAMKPIVPQQHLCAECGKIFSNRTLLNSHVKTHTTDKLYSCSKCPKKFKLKSTLRNHEFVHASERNFRCDLCDKTFLSRNGMAMHRKTHTMLKEHPCEVCGKCFKEKKYLKLHFLIHTGEKPHKCEHCDRSYRRRFDLLNHMRSHVGDNLYKCKECNESFRLAIELRRHSYQHYEQSKKT